MTRGAADVTAPVARDEMSEAANEKRETRNEMVLLYDPTAPSRTEAGEATERLVSLSGKVVGFIDNAKPNFNHLVDDLADLLVSNYGVKRIIKRRKASASVPAPEEVVRELADECDLVITGSGD